MISLIFCESRMRHNVHILPSTLNEHSCLITFGAGLHKITTEEHQILISNQLHHNLSLHSKIVKIMRGTLSQCHLDYMFISCDSKEPNLNCQPQECKL